MGIIRVEHTSNYTVMSNEHLRDQRLSLRAIGLMSKMLSNSDEYEYSVASLQAKCKEGRDAITTALKELEACGYLERIQQRKDGGFAGYDYVLHESPFTGFPSTGKPSTGKPITENPQLRNNNIQEILNPPKAPQGGRRDKSVPQWKPERFEGLWKFYPRGEKRQAAVKAWEKAHLSDDEIDQLGRMLRRQMRSELWQKNIGIPYLSTYLNQRRWEDELRGRSMPAEDVDAHGWAEDPEAANYG